MAGVLCSMVGASFVTAVAEVIRSKNSIIRISDGEIDTAQSKFGGASCKFNNVNNARLEIPNSSSLDLGSGNFTVECWAYFSGESSRISGFSRNTLLTKRTPNGIIAGAWGLYWDAANSNKLIWEEVASGGGSVQSSNNAISTGSWLHIAAVRSATTLTLYVNGTNVGSGTLSTNYTVNQNLFVGWWGSSFNSLNGWLDEIRVSNIARYTANFTAPTAPFVNDANTLLLIHADGTDASTFFEDDNGVRAQRGITAVGNAQVDTAQSQFGVASALFDGTGDYLTVDNIAGGITQDQTFEFWIRFANLPTAGGFRMVAGDGGGTRYLGLFNDSGTYRWEVSFAAGQYVERFTTSVATNTWYHVALTKSAATLKMYQGGTSLTSALTFGTMTAEKTLFVAGTNYIGSWNTSSNFLNGHMDEIRVSNTARYTSNFTAPTAPFVNDANTVLLIHADGTDASTVFRDDNGVRHQSTINSGPGFSLSSTQSQFGGTSLTNNGGSGTNNTLLQNINLTGVTTFTEELWVRFTSAGANESSYGLIHWFGGSARRIYVTFSNAGIEANRFYYAAGSFFFWNFTWAANTWYHIAVTRDSSNNVNAYVNGTSLGASQNISGAHFAAGFTGAWFGSFESSVNPIRGFIDEFRFSDVVRYTGNFTPATAPFVNDANTRALYHFDGTDASTVFRDDNGVTPTHQYT